MKVSDNTMRLCLILPSALLLIAVGCVYGIKAAMKLPANVLLNIGATFAPYTFVYHQYWRIVTSGFVHRGPIHFGLNAWALYVLTPMLLEQVGAVRCLLVFLLSMIGGALTSMLWDPNIISIGASGGICGMLGCYVAHAVHTKFVEKQKSNNFSVLGAFAVIAYCLLLGIATPGTDNASHFGGLTVGLILGIWSSACSRLDSKSIRLRDLSFGVCALVLVSLFLYEDNQLAHNKQMIALAEQQQASELEAHKKYRDALALLNRAINDCPNNDSLYRSRVQVLLELSDYQGVLPDAAFLLERDKSDTIAWLSRSIAHHKLGNDRAAVDDLAHLIALDPAKAIAYNNMAWSLIALRQYDKAMDCVNHALELNPHLATAHDTKAVLLTHLKRYGDALTELDNVPETKGNDGAAYFHRALIFSAQGNKTEAQRYRHLSEQMGYLPEAWESDNNY